MINLSASSPGNLSQAITNIPMDSEVLNVPLKVTYIITIIFNSITCPITVALNLLAIMAVKRRPRLQSYSNILLAYLAITDALTGLLVQPTYIIWRTIQILGGINTDTIYNLQNSFLVTVTLSSALHLMLVTCERLIAIKYTFLYPYLVTTLNIKVAVTVFWFLSLFCTILRRPFVDQLLNDGMGKKIGNVIIFIVMISCIAFIVTSYTILYKETAHQQKRIKTQQILQEEVERFFKEKKALKTTIYVVGAVLLCFSPGAVLTILDIPYSASWIITIAMLNSLLNPLVYCWRQKEMRQFVFQISSPAVAAVH